MQMPSRFIRYISGLEHKAKRKMQCSPTGGPKLTGARLARVTAQCDPKHLTVQPRYRRAA